MSDNDKSSALLASLTGEGGGDDLFASATGGEEREQDLFGEIPIGDPKPVENGDVLMHHQQQQQQQQQNQPDQNQHPQQLQNSQQQQFPSMLQQQETTLTSVMQHQSHQPAPVSQVPLQQQHTLPLSEPNVASIEEKPSNPSSLLASSGLLGGTSGPIEPINSGPKGPPKQSLLASSGLLGSGGGGGLFDDIDREEENKARREEELRLQEEEKQRKLEEQERMQREAEVIAMEQQRQQQQQQYQQQENAMVGKMNNININSGVYNSGPTQMVASQPYSTNYAPQIQSGQNPQVGVPQMGTSQPYPTSQQNQLGLNSSLMTQQQQVPVSSHMQPQAPQGQILYRNHQIPNSAAPDIPLDSKPNVSYVYNGNNPPMSQASVSTPQMNVNASAPNAHSSRYHPAVKGGTVLAGMNNANPNSVGHDSLGNAPQLSITKPPPVQTLYRKVTVSEPLLIQSGSGFFAKSQPYWSYQITTDIQNMNHPWIVRRRFRHVVALEERLREQCAGAILPPRPEKHATRAIEEATTLQSPEFARQRAVELESYLNHLITHPVVCQSQAIKLFLSLQDDLGTAWPEVSANAFTRLSAVGVSATMKLAETTSVLPNKDIEVGATEDSAEILALWSSESLRMGAVCQAVPKLEGAVTLFTQHGEVSGAVGMELNRMAKDLGDGDRELSSPIDLLSNGLLRQGRRTKRLGLELSAAMAGFAHQYKLCRNEKMAFMDRKAALQRRMKERSKADMRAQQLMMQQQRMGQHLGRYERDASLSDEMAVSAVRDCDEIGETLKREINRVAYERRMDWGKSVKVIASSMKEASTESIGIWESTRNQFMQAFPDYSETSEAM